MSRGLSRNCCTAETYEASKQLFLDTFAQCDKMSDYIYDECKTKHAFIDHVFSLFRPKGEKTFQYKPYFKGNQYLALVSIGLECHLREFPSKMEYYDLQVELDRLRNAMLDYFFIVKE